VVTQYFWPEPFRINDLVEGLVSQGHEVMVLTGYPNYPEGQIYPAFNASPGDFDAYAGAKVLRVPLLSRGKGSFRLALNYLSFVVSGLVVGPWRLRGQAFDAIFVFQTSPITSALPAIWFRRLKQAPLLMWVLDLWPESLAAIGVVKAPHLLDLVGLLVSFIYRHCDRILVQSMAMVPNIAKYAGDTSMVRYFPGWAEPIFQGPLEDVPPAPELAPFKDTFNLMFAGNIGVAQDFPAILQAVELLKDREDIRWLILGDGRSADALRAEIRERGLENRIHLLGRHSLERMPAFMRGADALLVSLKKHPAFSLTIPGKVQAYMAAGIPVIGMLDGEGARIISEAKAGFTCPAGDGASLARMVQQLSGLSKAERQAMGLQVREYCANSFDRSALITSLESWIEELRIKPPEPSSNHR